MLRSVYAITAQRAGERRLTAADRSGSEGKAAVKRPTPPACSASLWLSPTRDLGEDIDESARTNFELFDSIMARDSSPDRRRIR